MDKTKLPPLHVTAPCKRVIFVLSCMQHSFSSLQGNIISKTDKFDLKIGEERKIVEWRGRKKKGVEENKFYYLI